ncbi:protein of unknown function [Pseudodesulfovibrio piezophilus C1TLV30]|uniref:Uncharacterized protein n=1 Tax=Pseudodesulfovibrio piezophilus (strain DSM 21447 / JCM 15486 / C1TLV30) TaxID=1322246 RepID=M1WQ95_PSEP2|nr:protein of unknown function [Pseudodesulfovibrio piezophilus C1TLV30]
MNLHFKPNSGHTQRIGDSALIIHDEFLGQGVENLPVHRDGDGFGSLDNPVHIKLRDFTAFDRDDAMRIEALNVTPGDTGVDGADIASCHQLGVFEGFLDALDCLLDIHDNAASQSGGGGSADADDVDTVITGFAYHCAYFGGAYVKAHDEIVSGHNISSFL